MISTGVQGTLGYGVQGVRRREGFEGVRELAFGSFPTKGDPILDLQI